MRRSLILFSLVLKAKQDADHDKETLAYVVRKLLVSGVTSKLVNDLSTCCNQAAGTVNATVCRERLEMALVANVGLIAEKAAFEKKEIRTRTGLL